MGGGIYLHYHASNKKENHHGEKGVMRKGKGKLEIGEEGDGDLNSMGSPVNERQNWPGQLESSQGAQKHYPNFL